MLFVTILIIILFMLLESERTTAFLYCSFTYVHLIVHLTQMSIYATVFLPWSHETDTILTAEKCQV